MNKRYLLMVSLMVSLATYHVVKGLRMKRSIIVTSPSFEEGQEIPTKFTCEGEDVSPPLMWRDIPADTKSITLICDDPDAPGETWIHWVVFNLKPSVHELPEAAKVTRYAGAIEGKNSWGKNKYGGPCPPTGTHRYFFTIYALDIELPLHDNATKKDVEEAIKGHVLSQGTLMGTYQKKN